MGKWSLHLIEDEKTEPIPERYRDALPVRCTCGRFAKPGSPLKMDYQGEYWYSVICKEHGEVWIG